jgi:hypothetical protein
MLPPLASTSVLAPLTVGLRACCCPVVVALVQNTNDMHFPFFHGGSQQPISFESNLMNTGQHGCLAAGVNSFRVARDGSSHERCQPEFVTISFGRKIHRLLATSCNENFPLGNICSIAVAKGQGIGAVFNGLAWNGKDQHRGAEAAILGAGRSTTRRQVSTFQCILELLRRVGSWTEIGATQIRLQAATFQNSGCS